MANGKWPTAHDDGRRPGCLPESLAMPTVCGAMKIPLRQLAFVGLCLALAPGCEKKEAPAAEVAHDAESKLPVQEQVAPVAAAPAQGAPVVASAEVSSAEKD